MDKGHQKRHKEEKSLIKMFLKDYDSWTKKQRKGVFF